MSKRIVGLLVVGLLMGADPPNDDAKKDLQKLQGQWKLTALMVDGKAITPPPSNTKLVVKGAEYTFTNGGSGMLRGIYATDPTAKPPTLGGEGKSPCESGISPLTIDRRSRR